MVVAPMYHALTNTPFVSPRHTTDPANALTFKSTDELSVLFTRSAAMPAGSEPLANAPKPAPSIVPEYLINGNWPNSRPDPVMLIATVPVAERLAAVIGALVGLPKAPKFNVKVPLWAALAPRAREEAFNVVLELATVTPKCAPS